MKIHQVICTLETPDELREAGMARALQVRDFARSLGFETITEENDDA